MRLHKKRSVPDPGDAELTFPDFRKERALLTPGTLREECRNQDFGQEISFPPIVAWPQPDAGGTFCPGAISARLANNISAAFFRKTNRHFERTIWIERSESKMFWGTHELKQDVRNQQPEIRGRRAKERTPASRLVPSAVERDRRAIRRFFDNKDGVVRGEPRRSAQLSRRQRCTDVGFNLCHIRGADRAIRINVFPEIRNRNRLACLRFS